MEIDILPSVERTHIEICRSPYEIHFFYDGSQTCVNKESYEIQRWTDSSTRNKMKTSDVNKSIECSKKE